jgi:hypothetical protein
LLIRGNIALRIAKKIKNEKTEKNQNAAGPFPAGKQAQQACDERRQGKFVRILYHELEIKSLWRAILLK